jgi:hypothetical protein
MSCIKVDPCLCVCKLKSNWKINWSVKSISNTHFPTRDKEITVSKTFVCLSPTQIRPSFSHLLLLTTDLIYIYYPPLNSLQKLWISQTFPRHFYFIWTTIMLLYRVVKKSLFTWWLQYSKLQVMFKISPSSLQTFIDTPTVFSKTVFSIARSTTKI